MTQSSRSASAGENSLVFTETGEVVAGFHVLGNRHTPSYLLDGDRPVLFDGGMSFLARHYEEHARRALGARAPEILFLTHAHFDHCGAAGALKAAFPGLRIAASAAAAEILRRPRALELIRSLNMDAASLGPAIGAPVAGPAVFQPFEVDLLLSDGDEIDLGSGQFVRVLATPGHTRDFLSYYIPSRKILVASEAAGCANRHGQITAEFLADYDAYLSSLRRLSQLDVEVLCQGHEQVYVGRAAREFFALSLQETERYERWVAALLEAEDGSVEQVASRIKAVQWDPVPEPKQPERAYLLNTEARVRALAARPRPGEAAEGRKL